MEAKSWRHHYIQQFLINGFVNSKNKIYVYDKNKDEIFSDEKVSKSILFEKHKNTIFFDNNTSTSIIEDLLFKKLDNEFSILIKYLQTVDSTKSNIFEGKKTSDFLMFIVNLFWRIPYTDEISKNIIENAIAKLDNYSELKNNDSFMKQQRTLLYRNTLKNPENLKRKKIGCFTRLFEIENNMLLIGDNPIVYNENPNTFDDLVDLDFCIAISSNRLVMNSLIEVKEFGLNKRMNYNYAVLNQSERYVCSGDKNLLDASVKYYKNVKDLEMNNEFIKNIF